MTVRRHERKVNVKRDRRPSKSREELVTEMRAAERNAEAQRESIERSVAICDAHQTSPTTRDELIAAGYLKPGSDKPIFS